MEGHGGGDVVPIGGAEGAAAEGETLVAVGVDQGDGLVVGPARSREGPGRLLRGRRARHEGGSGAWGRRERRVWLWEERE